MRPVRLVFFGAGAFAAPTLDALAPRHDIALVVTQPDRPAGRGRAPTPTPVAQRAEALGLPLLRTSDVNADDAAAKVRGVGAEAFVVIAFGQKLRPKLLEGVFAINLHGSLLPRHRGAAPVNWAILSGDRTSGVCVITLAQRMDAGEILAEQATPIGPAETAGELHDRLAQLGPALVEKVLEDWRAGSLRPRAQDEALATRAPKLSRADAWVRFEQTAEEVRCRINGLSPWPGCTAAVGAYVMRLLRAGPVDGGAGVEAAPGTVREDLAIACGRGAVRLLEVQPPGGRVMTFAEFCRGRGIGAGAVLASSAGVQEAAT